GGKQRTPPKSKMTALTAAMSSVGQLFFPPRANLADGVDAPALAFEIRPGKDLAQESRADQHYAGDQSKGRQQHQRSVLLENIRVGQYLPYREQAQDRAAESRRSKAPLAEEVHRTREVFQQEPDGENIEHHPERATEAVVRSAGDALDV